MTTPRRPRRLVGYHTVHNRDVEVSREVAWCLKCMDSTDHLVVRTYHDGSPIGSRCEGCLDVVGTVPPTM